MTSGPANGKRYPGLETSGVLGEGRLCSCSRCHDDRTELQRSCRPLYEAARPALRVVDLFCGCGGMTLGVAEAARKSGLGLDVRLALDVDAQAHAVYAVNFPDSNVRMDRVETWFDGALGAVLTDVEAETAAVAESTEILVAGPPCQGYSDLNNHTRRDDPRNALYLRVARAAEVLMPRAILVENVPAVTRDRNAVVRTSIESLDSLGYSVAASVVDISNLGLPQTRHRHTLLAVRETAISGLANELFLRATTPLRCRQRSVRWAIEDLEDVSAPTAVDIPADSSLENRERMAWLFDNDEYDLPNRLRPPCQQKSHKYKSVYGRLRWDLPAQTVTSGFTSMGQGRNVHPSRPRTLTPHEAARLQGFPDFFDFTPALGRRARARLIANAVPPVLVEAFVAVLLREGLLAGSKIGLEDAAERTAPEAAQLALGLEDATLRGV